MKNFVTVLLSILLSGITAYAVVKASDHFLPKDETVAVAGESGSSEVRTVNLADTDYPDFTYAAESAVNAVVYVEVTVTARQSQQIDPFFRFFFGDEFGQQQREQKGSGSGVIIRPDGYIVTNNHVVQNASSIKVTLYDDRTFDATVIGTDPATDVALLKVEATGLPTIPFGDSDALRLGEWVIAIGSPLSYNLRSTITAGIVSAKGRSMPNTTGEFKIESFIQTDAAVNPGNSGGALVNKKGELVGINTAIISQTGSYSGYSFAVPSNIVQKIASDLIDYGSVKRAVLGITMQPIDDKIAKELKLSSRSGVYINEGSKGSAADAAGLRKGDVILSIGGTRIAGTSSVQEKVNGYHPGDKADITVLRDGKQKTFQVTFLAAAEANGTTDAEGAVAFYGARIKDGKNGVEIVSVGPGKMLEAGAAPGVIIKYVNDEPVSKAKDVLSIAARAKKSVFMQGVTPEGYPVYFGFGKE